MACVLAAALVPAGAVAQGRDAAARDEAYTLRVPRGPSISFPADTVERMLERIRQLRTTLQEDPDVLYYLGTRGEVTAARPAPAYPWNAVRVESDSVARVAVPGNYREAGRAYEAYAVETMEHVRREPPAARCAAAVEREARAVSTFVDGWIVARLLYGGPAFPPLDAFVFARDAGHLPAMLVDLRDTRIGGCARAWARAQPDEMEAYRAWRDEFDGQVAGRPLDG